LLLQELHAVLRVIVLKAHTHTHTHTHTSLQLTNPAPHLPVSTPTNWHCNSAPCGCKLAESLGATVQTVSVRPLLSTLHTWRHIGFNAFSPEARVSSWSTCGQAGCR